MLPSSHPDSIDLTAPITHKEMGALLEPLQTCLQRIEQHLRLQEIVRTPLPPNSPRGEGPPRSDSCAPQNAHLASSLFPSFTRSTASSTHETLSTPPMREMSVDPIDPTKAKHLQTLQVKKILKKKGFVEKITTAEKMMMKVEKVCSWWHLIREPVYDSCVYRLAVSRYFNTMCLMIIMSNSALVAYTTNWQIQNIGVTEPNAFHTLQECCLVWFVLELVVRMLGHRHHFFINHEWRWNIFDLTLVTISVVNFAFESVSDGPVSNLGYMRLLRLLKLSKIFRSVRSLRFLKSFHILLISFQNSFVSLFWGLVMLAFIMYLFALIFMQAMIDYFSSDTADLNLQDAALARFGSLGQALLSLYVCVTGGDDWHQVYNLVSHTGWMNALVFLFFTFLFLFAFFNILTAMLVEKAMATNEPERARVILEQRKRYKADKETFLQVCHAMDLNKNGVISWEECKEWMSHPLMISYMSSIGIEIYDVELFFTHVSVREGRDGKLVSSGEITIDHFVEGLMQMKGSATALDMQRQLFELMLLHYDVKDLRHHFRKQRQDIEHLLSLTVQARSIDPDSGFGPPTYPTSQVQLLPKSL